MSNEDRSREHYSQIRYRDEHQDLVEAQPNYKNIGWSLGNRCPLKCEQCYSRSAREIGQNLDILTVDFIIGELQDLKIETVNLGGNEPIYTNGLDPKHSKLPYIVSSLTSRNIKVGITSAGPTITTLERYFPNILGLLNDVDISLDSPHGEEHDKNRGQKGIFNLAMRSLDILERRRVPRTLIMCAMQWNFTEDRISAMIQLAKNRGCNVRFNPIKPVEKRHLPLALSPEQFYKGLSYILQQCDVLDLSDPAWAASGSTTPKSLSGCYCGTNSFRIHSITPDGQIPISPCVYLHDYKFGDLSAQPLSEILNSPPFREFRRRKQNPESINGCQGCNYLKVCGAGCAARGYLYSMHEDDTSRSIFKRDPYCPTRWNVTNYGIDHVATLNEIDLVHKGYLCTGIFKPK